MIVVFTGIDGSGKTTQAELLRDALLEEGIDARYEHLTGPNLKSLQILKSHVAESFLNKEEKVQLNPNDNKSESMKPIGLFFLYRGIWQSWFNVVSNRNANVVILDRYLYDDLVRVHWKYAYAENRLSKLTSLVPEPDIIFHLDVKPEIGQNRESGRVKPLEIYEQKRNCVNKINKNSLPDDSTIMIDTSEKSIEQVRDRVFSELMSEYRNYE